MEATEKVRVVAGGAMYDVVYEFNTDAEAREFLAQGIALEFPADNLTIDGEKVTADDLPAVNTVWDVETFLAVAERHDTDLLVGGLSIISGERLA